MIVDPPPLDGNETGDCATAARIKALTPGSDNVAALFNRTKRFSLPLP